MLSTFNTKIHFVEVSYSPYYVKLLKGLQVLIWCVTVTPELIVLLKVDKSILGMTQGIALVIMKPDFGKR